MEKFAGFGTVVDVGTIPFGEFVLGEELGVDVLDVAFEELLVEGCSSGEGGGEKDQVLSM